MGLNTALRIGFRGVGQTVTAAAPSLTVTDGRPGVYSGVASPWSPDGVLNRVNLAELFGGSANLPLSRADAMTVPAVARSRHIICTTLARLPLQGFSADVPVASPLLSQPDPAVSRWSQLLWTFDDILFYGFAYWVVISRYSTGGIRQLRRIELGRVTPNEKKGGYDILDTGRTLYYPASEVIRIDGPHEGLLNYGSAAVRKAANLELAAEKATRNPVPQIELHQTSDRDLTEAEISGLVAAWVKARNDPNSGGVAYTNRHVQAISHGAQPEHLLTEGRNHAALDIARTVGIPASSIDAAGPSSMTYANLETRNAELIDYGLSAYGAALEARLSMDDVLPHGTYCAFDYDPLKRADFATRMTGYKTATESGAYTTEEVRALERGVPMTREDVQQ